MRNHLQDWTDWIREECFRIEAALAVYAFNYNWDNGFSVPSAILDNRCCSLGTALLLFELADGFTYLESRQADPCLPAWSAFIADLYDRILGNTFPAGSVSFASELSKVQLSKLKKHLTEEELVFITPIDGTDCRMFL